MKKQILSLLCALTVLLGAIPIGTVPAARALEGEALRASDTLKSARPPRGETPSDCS